jgi:hypothetical protein
MFIFDILPIFVLVILKFCSSHSSSYSEFQLAADCQRWMYPDWKMNCKAPKSKKHQFCDTHAPGDLYVLTLQDFSSKGNLKIHGLWKADCSCDARKFNSFDASKISSSLLLDMKSDWIGLSAPGRTDSICYGWIHEWVCHGACLGLNWDFPTFFSKVITLYRQYKSNFDKYKNVPAICFKSNDQLNDLVPVSCSNYQQLKHPEMNFNQGILLWFELTLF